MTLKQGTKLGPYEILSPIAREGWGGMESAGHAPGPHRGDQKAHPTNPTKELI